jgi:outer membrane protein assembly factor BamB
MQRGRGGEGETRRRGDKETMKVHFGRVQPHAPYGNGGMIGAMSETNLTERPLAADAWFPGIFGQGIIVVSVVVVILSRLAGYWEYQPWPLDDTAVRNLLTLVFSFIIVATMWVWFCFRSVYSLTWRRVVTWVPVVSVGIGFPALLMIGSTKVIQFSGSMVPRLAPGERALEKVEGAKEAIDLATTGPDDFPQFLGPERSVWVADKGLAEDWEGQQPVVVWKRPIGSGWSGFAAVNGYAVTLEQRGAEEAVVCYAIETGEPVWAHSIVARHEQAMGGIGPRSTPTIHQGRVYALGGTGVLRCLDGSNGKEIWSDDLRERYGLTVAEDEAMIMWGRSASPLIVDSIVIVPGGGPLGKAKNLVAFEAESGKVVWESESLKEDGTADQVSYASPGIATLAGRRQILIVNETTASGHDPATGKLLWSYPWPSHSNGDACASQAVAIDDRQVLLSKGYSAGAELIEVFDGKSSQDLATKSKWKLPKVLQTKLTNVVIRDGHAFGLSEGILECVELDSGKRKWKSGRFGHGQILGVGEKLLVLSEEGELSLVELNAKKYVNLGTVPAIEGKTWNTLCLYGKKLLVRNSQEAACLELP